MVYSGGELGNRRQHKYSDYLSGSLVCTSVFSATSTIGRHFVRSLPYTVYQSAVGERTLIGPLCSPLIG